MIGRARLHLWTLDCDQLGTVQALTSTVEGIHRTALGDGLSITGTTCLDMPCLAYLLWT